jgi:hypothetical protein
MPSMDPDGNLVNLFTPVSEEAIKKFSRTDDLRPALLAVEKSRELTPSR